MTDDTVPKHAAAGSDTTAVLDGLLRRVEAARDAVVAIDTRLAKLAGNHSLTTEPAGRLSDAPPIAPGQGTHADPSEPSEPSEPAEDPDSATAIAALVARLLGVAIDLAGASPAAVDAGFDRYLALIHSTRKGTPMLDDGLRRYSFVQLVRNGSIYLFVDGDSASFRVDRSVPADLTDARDEASVFLAARTRMPTPIRLRRDAAAGNRWRIESSSL